MLDIIHGQTKNPQIATELRQMFDGSTLTGTLYIGYPVVATAHDSITVDALLVTEEHGLVALIFPTHIPASDGKVSEWEDLVDRQDQLYVAVENNLRRHEGLRAGRELAVSIQVITVLPSLNAKPSDLNGTFSDLTTLKDLIRAYPALPKDRIEPLNAALQRVSTIRPAKRRSTVTSSESKGALLRQIESEIANLDQWQKQAAIESPDGPQRIRGLAGSGKTVVLALKAAYLHAQHPEWTIAVTFSSRALYQQFEDLVRRFSFEHLNDEPNWDRIRLLHSWGGAGRMGLYQQIAVHIGVTPRDFFYARSKYGRDSAFEGVCSELLASIMGASLDPIFDAVLIDEAQDLPVPFFRLIYEMTRPPKRIVWAYDDLQNLSASVLPTLDEQFGQDANGNPNVALANSQNSPRQDIILPICYRNTPWAIALAHGLGLGTARPHGMVQSFDDPSLWTKVGYTVETGSLQKGSDVTLKRSPDSSPRYFSNLLTPGEAIQTHSFSDAEAQAQWVASSIRTNLQEDELEHDDILVVMPNVYTAKSEAQHVLTALAGVGIESHIVGVTTTQDEMFKPDSIAIANIFRSKGNECPMVYVLNAQHCVANRRLAAMRNTLFTAITRSKAWVRISGWGPEMTDLEAEIDKICSNGYRLKFSVPTDDQLASMRRLHRDLSAGEKDTLKRVEDRLRTAVEEMERGGISIDDLASELRTTIAKRFGLPTRDP